MSGEADPFGDEPEGQDAVDAMNEEIRARHAGRPPAELIAAYDDSYDRLMRALEALPEAQLRSADAYPWTEGRALIDVPFTGHLHEEHVPDVRARLDRG